MRNNQLIQLEYQQEGFTYVFTVEDVEELLADYVLSHNVSETYGRELERYVWQFLKFLKDKKIVKGEGIKAPQSNERYVLSREVLVEYVNALADMGYSNSSVAKRLQTVIIVLRRLGVSEVLLDVLRDPLRKANIGRKIEQEENTPTLKLDDAREFFRRLERLFMQGKLSKKRYVKALAFSLLLFSTGRRVSEVIQIKIDDIDFETHSIRMQPNQTKEGKLLGISSGTRIVFMTEETEETLRYYIENNMDEIRKNGGYLFMRPGKRSLKDTFLHKIVKMSKETADPDANLEFITSDGLHSFEIKYFRKLFIQEWERLAEKKGIFNDRVLVAARKLTGHRPSNDIHRVNYAKISYPEIWEYYRKLYYTVSVLTESQRELIGIAQKKREVQKNERSLRTPFLKEVSRRQKQNRLFTVPLGQLQASWPLN